jgi:hypothetical protein
MTPTPSIPRTSTTRADSVALLVFALAYGAFVYAIGPGWPIAMNDDFAYLRSIVETIQHGRPWTDDFLEPWSLSLAALSAGIFKISGSFTLATVGFQVLLAAASFWFVGKIAREKGCSATAAIAIAASLLTFPTVLWKHVEFTAVILYFPCFCAALLFALQRRWMWFSLAFALAAANRPSAVAWLVLPGLAAVQTLWRERSWRRTLPAVAAIAFGGGWLFFVSTIANRTHAQRFITQNIFADARAPTVESNLKIALWVLLTAIGYATLLRRLLQPRVPPPKPKPIVSVVGWLVALGLLLTVSSVASGVPLSWEHPLFENTWAVGYLRGLVVLAAIGWAIGPRALDPALLVAAVAATALASLRSQLWDYYLVDGAVLAFFAVPAVEQDSAPAPTTSLLRHWLRPALAGAVVLALVSFQIVGSGPMKRLVDHRAGACSVLEKALRAGWMKPTELSDAPFGFVAWHFLPYYLKHEGQNSPDLGGFGNYIAGHSVNVRIEGVTRREARAARSAAAAPDPAHPFSEIHPRGWFGYARFTLDRLDDPKPPAWPFHAEDYRYPPFPLNDAEWRELARAQPAK